jgi:uracil-DNA glycosylase
VHPIRIWGLISEQALKRRIVTTRVRTGSTFIGTGRGASQHSGRSGPILENRLHFRRSTSRSEYSCPTAWWELLEGELGGTYLTGLLGLVDANGAGIFPQRDDVFRALELTPPGETKVVLVGQDPYHDLGQAHGLCFSVRPGFKPLPPSLRIILQELERDGFRASDDGNLEPCSRQGVLLLNTALTVQEGKPGSHSARWRRFTDAVIRIAAREPDRVFLLWGAHAQKKKPIITATRGSEANILKSSHPAPPACYRPCGDGPAFVKSRPFRNTNELLKSSRRGQIDWNLA